MKMLGIVRRIDDLGRIVVPKEIRRALKIQEGDALEFYIDDNKLILEKYKPSREEQVSNILEEILNFFEELPYPPMDIINQINEVLEEEPNIGDYEKAKAFAEQQRKEN